MIATLGMPCIYYGTDQAFDGYEGYHDTNIEALGQDGKIPFQDRYIRESMFYQETARMVDVLARMHKEYQIDPVIVLDIPSDRVIVIIDIGPGRSF